MKLYKLKLNIFSWIVALFIPTFTFADSGFSLTAAGTNFKTVIGYVISVLSVLIPILVGAAFIVFFWRLSKFILSSNNQADIAKGKNYMIWGVLALFILITFKTIITLVSQDLGLNGNSSFFPFLPVGGGDVTTSETFIPPSGYTFVP